MVLDDDSGSDGGSCHWYSPCQTLYYALSYLNSYQQSSNNITVVLDSDYGNYTYQKWNTSLLISETSSSIRSYYHFAGQGPNSTIVEVFESLISSTYDALYYVNEYGADFVFEDFTLQQGDSTTDRKFIQANTNYYDGSFTFRNIIFDSYDKASDYFIYDYSSSSNGQNKLVFEDCIIIDSTCSYTYWVYQYYSGGVSIDNMVVDRSTWSQSVFYIRYPWSAYSTGVGTEDSYITNMVFNDTSIGSYFLYVYYMYTYGSWVVANIDFMNHYQGSYFAYIYPIYDQYFVGENITLTNGTYMYQLFNLRGFDEGVWIRNVHIEDSYLGSLLYLDNAYQNETIIENITYINSEASYVLQTDDVYSDLIIRNVYFKNTPLNYGFEFFWISTNTILFENITFEDRGTDQYILIYLGATDCRYNYTTYECVSFYDSGSVIIHDMSLINADNYWGAVIFRAQYLEIDNYQMYSTTGLGRNNSYVSGPFTMDWGHEGTTKVTNMNVYDSVIQWTVYSQFGWKESYVNGITCDNCHTDNEWVFFEFYNAGEWHNNVSNIYIKGYYQENNMSNIASATGGNCTHGYWCDYFAQGIFYFYYDGEATESREGDSIDARRRTRRRGMDKHIDMDMAAKYEDEALDFEDELQNVLDDTSLSQQDARRKLLFFYEYYDLYQRNYTMNCDKYFDVYYNINVIDNAVFGPIVMIDIETNDCPMVFDNWKIEDNTNLIGKFWDTDGIEDPWLSIFDSIEVDSDEIDGGGEYSVFLIYYQFFYGLKLYYPDVEESYVPPGIFFSYQYHSHNEGIVKITNAYFANNIDFALVTCSQYSYCKVLMIDCVFENNVISYNGSSLLNTIFMEDDSYGNITIIDSQFIGDYASQDGGVDESWLYDPDKNSYFECRRCRYIDTAAPTLSPTEPTQSPTNEPTEQPTEPPTPTYVDHAVAVTIYGDISTDLTKEVSNVCVL